MLRELHVISGKEAADKDVISFIEGFLGDHEIIWQTFTAGYCYYFAVMLKDTFQRGEICWCAPYGHICWVDDNGVPYDISGVCDSECDFYIPVRYIPEGIADFKHIPHKAFNASKEYIETAIQLAVSQPSIVAPQPIDNICAGFFPFYEKRQGITTPKYAPEFDVLPKEIRELFVKAFVEGYKTPTSRPDAVTWYHALNRMQQKLKNCSVDRFHMYPEHLKKCPWCELEQKMKNVPSKASPITQNTWNQPVVSANKSVVNNGSSHHKIAGNTKQATSKIETVISSTTAFWIGTIGLVLGVQGIIMGLYGNAIVGEIFGYSYGEGVDSWGTNLAVWLGPWGFVICAIVGMLIYNTYWCNSGKLYGYKWYHYLLSLLTSFVFSAGYILLILVVSLAIMLIMCALVIGLVCAFLSGS